MPEKINMDDPVKEPLVSVLITVYNREKYLASAIDSVLAQTFQDFEIIIVDDVSTDHSVEIINKYVEKDSRIHFYSNEKNLGDYPTRNVAASLARGKYLKYVDADDLIWPHGLSIFVETMENFPAVTYALSGVNSIFPPPRALSPEQAYTEHFIDESGLFSAAPLQAIIRRDAFEKIGGFDVLGRCTGDLTCWLSLSREGSMAITYPGLFWWRTHNEQESAWSRDWNAASEVAARSFQTIKHHLEHRNCPLPLSFRKYALHKQNKRFFRRMAWHILKGRFRVAFFEWRQTKPGIKSLLSVFFPIQRIKRNEVARKNPPCVSMNDNLPALVEMEHCEKIGVSVLLPVRNAEKTIEQVIKSILKQTRTDWELIVLDDASDDNTWGILQVYAPHPRIKLIRNDEHIGYWKSRIKAAESSQGPYLKILDELHVLFPHAFQIMMGHMCSHPNAGIGMSGACGPFREGICMKPETSWTADFFSTPRFSSSLSHTIIRREAFFEAVKHHTALNLPLDDRFFQLVISSICGLVLINDGLVWPFANVQQLGKHPIFFFKGKHAIRLVALLSSSLCPLSREDANAAKKNVRATIAEQARYLLKKGAWKKARRLIREQKVSFFTLLKRRDQWHYPPIWFHEKAEMVRSGPLEKNYVI